jgi:hypothetical protein
MTDKILSEAAQAMGRKGGLSKSERKRASSAANGKLSNGRPSLYDWYLTVTTNDGEQTFIFTSDKARRDFIAKIKNYLSFSKSKKLKA